MRAVQLTGFGGPDRLVYREDVPDPMPGPGEVRVRVGAAAINNTDIWTREGAYGTAGDPTATTGWRREPLVFPRIQGADIAGRIDQVGPGVDTARVGERVLIDPMLYEGDESALVTTDYLGSERDGGFAELVTVPASNALPVDSPLSDVELASFPTSSVTALRMIDRAAVTDADTVLITGASGGVGAAAIQLVKARGGRVVAVVGAGKKQQALDLGADAVIVRGRADLDEELSALDVTGAGGQVDVVVDVVGGAAFSALLRSLRPLGRYVVAGAIAGPLVETDLRTVYLRQLQIIGSSFGTHAQFRTLLDHIARGELRPLVAGTYPLRELRRAQEDFVAKTHFGKLVVLPQEN
ncbi:zinc-binding dehydrogenase [Actinoalloteichus hymeniacidonis]|uniref:Zn-dependent oxidoreductase, NADPH:quinone reductase n=1 Tax=Actinoalloteichus hymeniacidonis TaxID=340345 RepID=A0AAC9MXJ8_9PSEU|nr:zinc-binding dehydrogenase [Actinoalloteichus hymeniacidonis]AOS62116.1 Zn-dependent oxidoreductase, NADPH:quinone reductase [Actinoalloteichus hymeniacidonis]MBB5909862.1 NADPH:quinone reductase-like Zn-dependent oxidoreductase [Actinoalloteichus hymeniacidonis]